MKNSNDNTGNRTRDLLACSAVPQPIAPPRAPNKNFLFLNHKFLQLFAVQLTHLQSYTLTGKKLCLSAPLKLRVFW